MNPGNAATRTASGWLAVGRAVRALAHVLRGLWTVRTQFGRLSPAQSDVLVAAWSRQLLTIMGVELVVVGQPARQGPLLVVANHSSWLDILVLNAAQPSRFVSKADVRHWPVLGALVAGAGTLFIERENRRDAMRVVHHMAERLAAGEVLTVFPEGTTGDGQHLLPFHANLLQAAISAPAPVLPVGLRFLDAASGQPSLAPLFVGDTTLVASLWTTLRARGLQAVVHCGLPQEANGLDRRSWARQLHGEVARLAALAPQP